MYICMYVYVCIYIAEQNQDSSCYQDRTGMVMVFFKGKEKWKG